MFSYSKKSAHEQTRTSSHRTGRREERASARERETEGTETEFFSTVNAMGISGLLPALAEITTDIHISAFRDLRVAVDAYVWLHRGAYACNAQFGQDSVYLPRYVFICPYFCFFIVLILFFLLFLLFAGVSLCFSILAILNMANVLFRWSLSFGFSWQARRILFEETRPIAGTWNKTVLGF